ncbi:MAG TPA: hypothetical protein VF928_06355 [Usitatibacteraceae bacterium]
MFSSEFWEPLSFIVTSLGLPCAIAIFLYEQRRERRNEEEAEYQLLSDAYTDFLKVVLANPDLRLRSSTSTPDLTPEQEERMLVIFDMLVSLFERAYLVAFQVRMSPDEARRWNSWEDFMREWCRREDFRKRLPQLLRGEDPAFAAYIERLAAEESAALPA